MATTGTRQMAAKFPGTCAKCGARFPAGTQILWAPGAQAAHLACPAPLAAAPQSGAEIMAAEQFPQRPRSAPRNWRPCGYPGCHPSHCDECDGRGSTSGRYSGGW